MAMGVQVGTKNSSTIAFWCRNQFKKDKQHTHNHNPHHRGKLLPPPAMQIFYLQPIQHKLDIDEGLGKGMVKAIQLNRITDRIINSYLTTLLFTMDKNDNKPPRE